MLKADEISNVKIEVSGMWVAAKPEIQPLPRRIKDAIQVVLGKAEAIKFYNQ